MAEQLSLALQPTTLTGELTSRFPSEGWGNLSGIAAPADFLAHLLERMRTLDGQLLGLLLGQMPSSSSLQSMEHGVQSAEREVLRTTPPIPHPQPSVSSPLFAPLPLNASPISPLDADRPLLTVFPSQSPVPNPQSSTESASFSVQQLIVQTAQRYGVDPALALAVAKAESNFDPNALSPKGAMGVMQLMPQTAKSLGVTNPFDPQQNIDGGIRYLRQLIEQFGGNISLAVAAYNAGPTAVRRYNGVPPYPETQTFLRRVLSYWQSFRQALANQNAEPSSSGSVSRRTLPTLFGNPSSPTSAATPSVLKSPPLSISNASIVTSGGDIALQQQLPFASEEANDSQMRIIHTHRLSETRLLAPSLLIANESGADFVSTEQLQQSLLVRESESIAAPSVQAIKGSALSEKPFASREASRLLEKQELHGSSATEVVRATPTLEASAMQQSERLATGSNGQQGEAQRVPPSPFVPRTASPAPSVIHRLAIEVPIAEDGERLRLQVSLLPKNMEAPTVQVTLRVSDERWAAQLANLLPSLRQHLWEQGIALAQWTVATDGREGGGHDPAEQFGDWRRLPSASLRSAKLKAPEWVPHLPAPSSPTPDEGIWA